MKREPPAVPGGSFFVQRSPIKAGPLPEVVTDGNALDLHQAASARRRSERTGAPGPFAAGPGQGAGPGVAAGRGGAGAPGGPGAPGGRGAGPAAPPQPPVVLIRNGKEFTVTGGTN